MVETQQASGGSLVGLAIIFLIILLLFPAFAIWLLYVAIVNANCRNCIINSRIISVLTYLFFLNSL
jgi:hypothetical protein